MAAVTAVPPAAPPRPAPAPGPAVASGPAGSDVHVRRAPGIPAPRGVIARGAPPAVAGAVAARIPGEPRGAHDAEMWGGAPAHDPRRGQPGPAVARVVDIGIGGGIAGGAVVRVAWAVWHPDPAVLAGVDPLARG